MKRLLCLYCLIACGTASAEAQSLLDKYVAKQLQPKNYVYKSSGEFFMLKKGKEKKVSSFEKNIDTLFIEDPSMSVGRVSKILDETQGNGRLDKGKIIFVSNNIPYFHPIKLDSKVFNATNRRQSGTISGVFGFQALEENRYGSYKNYGEYKEVSLSLPDAVCIDGEEEGLSGYFAGSEIVNITFSPSIKKIGKGAFRDCRSLQEVIFQDGCDTVDIDPEAFVGCIELKQIRVPDGRFDYYVSKGLSPALLVDGEAKLEATIKLEKPGTILNELSMEKLNKISSLTVIGIMDENDIKVIGECKSLKYLNLKDAYSTLSNAEQEKRNAKNEFLQGMFQAMGELSEVKYRNGEISAIDNLQVQLFTELAKGSSNVQNASVGCIIPQKAFCNMNHLESVILPARASIIEHNAFMGCKKLNSVVLPPYLVKIGRGAFANCTNLQSVDFPSTLTSIGGYDQQLTYGESGIASFVNTGIEKFDFSKCSFTYNTRTDKSWTYSFFDCNNLKEVRLPKGISNIEVWFFSDMAVECYVPSSVKRLKIFNAREIHFASPEPPDILNEITGCSICVPKGCMTKYYAKFNGNGNTIKEE